MNPLMKVLERLVAKNAIEKVANNETVKGIANDAAAGAEMLGQGLSNAASDTVKFVGDTANKVGDKASKVLSDAANAGKSAFNSALDSYFKMFGLGFKDGKVYSPEMEKMMTDFEEQAKKGKLDTETLGEVIDAVQEKKEETKEPVVDEEEDDEVVTYTYKPGDTFGQVLLDLGLSDGSNLWGRGGDVDFYTQQLRSQNMLDSLGNVKVGVPFQLRRRK